MKIFIHAFSPVLSGIREAAQFYTGLGDMVYTSSVQQACYLVGQHVGRPERAVVVATNVFFNGTVTNPRAKFMTAVPVAASVKAADPRAWFFVYAEPDLTKHHLIDGIIPTEKEVNSADLVAALLAQDFSQFKSVDDIRRVPALSWLK